MKLAEYLYKNQIRPTTFAHRLGVTRQTLYNYLADPDTDAFRIPRREVMAKIVKYTNWQVTPNDMYHLSKEKLRDIK